MNVLLFGEKSGDIQEEAMKHASLAVVSAEPDAVICYGGDGTLLAAEREWPCVPKVPIRNSRRGHRCIAHPADQVIERLAAGALARTEYLKIECAVRRASAGEADRPLTAMNEFNLHMARVNSAVRFRMWLDGEPYNAGQEILGDGFVISTPFGSTAYFNHITRGFFHAGIGIAFKSTSEHTNHVVVSEATVLRIAITRGPATLAYDNSTEYLGVGQGDEMAVRKHPRPAVIMTWEPMKYPSDAF